MVYDVLGVVAAAAAGQQPADEFLAGHVEVHRGLHLGPEGLGHGKGRLGLVDGTREPVQDVAVGLGRGHDRLPQHVHDQAIRDQVAVIDVGLDLAPQRRLLPDVLAQQVAAGDVGQAEPLGEQLGLCSLACAGGADKQQPHLITRSEPGQDAA